MALEKEVVIIGAGIIGAAIAYELAHAGADVTILDRGQPAQGATANSFAWINASRGKKPYHYYQLNRLGISAWQHLDRQMDGRLPVRWGGSLEWFHEPDKSAEVMVASRRHQAWGYPIREVDRARFAALEPKVIPGAMVTALHGEIEGHVDPVLATTVLLAEAQRLGAKLMVNCAVKALEQSGDRVTAVVTDAGRFATDALVIAAGTGTPQVAAMVGVKVPLQDSPGVLVHTRPTNELIKRIVLSPHGHMKQKPDGRIVIGASFKGTEGTDDSLATGRSQLDHAAQSLPQLADLEVEKVTLGWRVLPQDELPIIGFCQSVPNLYIAAMHSGITLGPLVGQVATLEIVNTVKVAMLEPYRLERFS